MPSRVFCLILQTFRGSYFIRLGLPCSCSCGHTSQHEQRRGRLTFARIRTALSEAEVSGAIQLNQPIRPGVRVIAKIVWNHPSTVQRISCPFGEAQAPWREGASPHVPSIQNNLGLHQGLPGQSMTGFPCSNPTARSVGCWWLLLGWREPDARHETA